MFAGRSGHIHHKDSKGMLTLDDFNDLKNLELLCIGCHRKAHREY